MTYHIEVFSNFGVPIASGIRLPSVWRSTSVITINSFNLLKTTWPILFKCDTCMMHLLGKESGIVSFLRTEPNLIIISKFTHLKDERSSKEFFLKFKFHVFRSRDFSIKRG